VTLVLRGLVQFTRARGWVLSLATLRLGRLERLPELHPVPGSRLRSCQQATLCSLYCRMARPIVKHLHLASTDHAKTAAFYAAYFGFAFQKIFARGAGQPSATIIRGPERFQIFLEAVATDLALPVTSASWCRMPNAASFTLAWSKPVSASRGRSSRGRSSISFARTLTGTRSRSIRIPRSSDRKSYAHRELSTVRLYPGSSWAAFYSASG
jgi:hypothetical protein